MKILIVEDDPSIRLFLKDAISSLEHVVRTAEDGMKGWEAMEEFKPDVVLTDIQMPKMDGLELLKKIRMETSETIVVVMTAFGCEDYAIKALQLNANNYLKKPVSLKTLTVLLKKYSALVEKPASRLKAKVIDGKITTHYQNEIEKIPEIVDALVTNIEIDLGKAKFLDVRLGLNELLTNAMEHGNLEMTPESQAKAYKEDGDEGIQALYKKQTADPDLGSRKVTVDYKQTDDCCEWLITDEGNGFDWRKVMKQYEGTGFFYVECKGIFICNFHFDFLEYLEEGNVVRARKYLAS